ncbi:hypothetical protein BH11ARM1_BH11ARM1_02070 [soil metagenome]
MENASLLWDLLALIVEVALDLLSGDFDLGKSSRNKLW